MFFIKRDDFGQSYLSVDGRSLGSFRKRLFAVPSIPAAFFLLLLLIKDSFYMFPFCALFPY